MKNAKQNKKIVEEIRDNAEATVEELTGLIDTLQTQLKDLQLQMVQALDTKDRAIFLLDAMEGGETNER